MDGSRAVRAQSSGTPCVQAVASVLQAWANRPCIRGMCASRAGLGWCASEPLRPPAGLLAAGGGALRPARVGRGGRGIHQGWVGWTTDTCSGWMQATEVPAGGACAAPPCADDARTYAECRDDGAAGLPRAATSQPRADRLAPGPLALPAGLQLDPANEQMKQGLQDARSAAAAAARGPAGPMGGLFTQPEVLSRLATNPQVRRAACALPRIAACAPSHSCLRCCWYCPRWFLRWARPASARAHDDLTASLPRCSTPINCSACPPPSLLTYLPAPLPHRLPCCSPAPADPRLPGAARLYADAAGHQPQPRWAPAFE